MDSEKKENRYIVCPVCKKPNPAGARFCQYCWGAALNQDISYSEEELEELDRRREAFLKRKKRIKTGIFSGIGAVIVALTLVILINFTDAITSPDEALSSNSAPGDWAMFRHDNLRSGSDGNTGLIPEGVLKWSFTTGSAIHSSPAVSGNTVYFGSQDYHLYAVNTETGDLRWDFEAGSRVDSSPAVVDGRVYFGSNDGFLYVVDAGTGEKIWNFKTRYPVRSGPAIAGDTVYFGSDDYYLYALDIETGEERWKTDTRSPAGSSPVVDNGIVYQSSPGSFSYAYDANTGRRRLSFNTAISVHASPVVDNGVVYFATTNGMLYAVDQTARTWLWEHDIRPYWAQLWVMLPFIPEPPEQSGLLWVYSLRKANATTPVIEDGIMYLGASEYVLAIDLETQQTLWEFRTGGMVRSAPAKAGSVIYAGSLDGNLYALDAVTGELHWKFKTGAEIVSSPAVVDGVVYVGSYDGKFYAIE